MKFKKIVATLSIILTFFALQASDDESTESQATILCESPDTNVVTAETKLTLAQRIAASREAQKQARLKESKKIKIGTVATLYTEIHQLFNYGSERHGKVYFENFNKHYSEDVGGFIQAAQATCSLSDEKTDRVYRELRNDSGSKDVCGYEIIGETPSTQGFNDSLYNINKARLQVVELVRQYIDANKADVSAKCIGLGLQTTVSQDVWAPGCCHVQMHRSCFKQCKHNKVGYCPNPFCQQVKDGDSYPLSWTDEFYEEVLKNPKIVKSSAINTEDCPICMKSLKTDVSGVKREALGSLALKSVKRKK